MIKLKNKFLLYKFLLYLLLGLPLLAGLGQTAYAQTCSVSSSKTAAGVGTTACFVKAGNQLVMSITGTWVATNQIQMSVDGQVTWRVVGPNYTANVQVKTGVQQRDVWFRWFPSAFTSGTIAYTLADLSLHTGKYAYTNVPLAFPYTANGASAAFSVTLEPITDVYVQTVCHATAIGYLVGTTGGTTKVIAILRDSKGELLGNSLVAGRTLGTASTIQELSLLVPVDLPAGRYYVSFQGDAVTGHLQKMATSTFVDVTASELTSVFGTIPRFIAPPTTFTAAKGPFAFIRCTS
jgi:hypothetical protein